MHLCKLPALLLPPRRHSVWPSRNKRFPGPGLSCSANLVILAWSKRPVHTETAVEGDHSAGFFSRQTDQPSGPGHILTNSGVWVPMLVGGIGTGPPIPRRRLRCGAGSLTRQVSFWKCSAVLSRPQSVGTPLRTLLRPGEATPKSSTV